MTTLGATKTGAMLAVKGTKKVAKGTVRVVKGKQGSDKHKDGAQEDYDARALSDRRQANLIDRISQMVTPDDSNNDLNGDDGVQTYEEREAEAAALAAAAMLQEQSGRKNSHGHGHAQRRGSKQGTGQSILMPTNLSAGNDGSWDV